ncbi:MAG: LamG domain-containing protein [Anaerolineae bacterium]|nr:MAG: LamG domain-containing protein [Anaerolineae bacterium]
MLTHVVGPGGQKLYIDGQLAASGVKAASSYVGDSRVLLGEASQASSTRFTGLLDEVKVFPVALSAEQVTALYHSWARSPSARPGRASWPPPGRRRRLRGWRATTRSTWPAAMCWPTATASASPGTSGAARSTPRRRGWASTSVTAAPAARARRSTAAMPRTST